MTGNASLIASGFAVDANAPRFGYVDVLLSGHVHQGFCYSNGTFVESSIRPTDVVAFVVSKDRKEAFVRIDVKSAGLNSILRDVISRGSRRQSSSIGLPEILASYRDLKMHLQNSPAESQQFDRSLAELSLLLNDVLCDSRLYDGIGLDNFQRLGLISDALEQDIRSSGLDTVDICFQLGDASDEALKDEDNQRWSRDLERHALSGNLTALAEWCQKHFRSERVELKSIDPLLLRVLDRGHWESFQYVLDVAAAKDAEHVEILEQGGELYVTYNPLYVAIRLGHAQTVQALLREGGDFCDFQGPAWLPQSNSNLTRVEVTPVSAAFYWNKPEIVRILLQDRSIQRRGFDEALKLSGQSRETFPQWLQSWVAQKRPARSSPVAGGQFSGGSSSGQFRGASLLSVASGSSGSSRSQGRASAAAPPEQGARQVFLQRRRKHHRRRQDLGWRIRQSLERLCAVIRSYAARQPMPVNLQSAYSSFKAVWKRGNQRIQQLMKNEPPKTLVDVLDCLLVTSAMCDAYCPRGDSLRTQFLDDLERWKTALPAEQHALFKDIIFHLWRYTPNENERPRVAANNELFNFSQTVQNLAELELQRAGAGSLSPFAQSDPLATSPVPSNVMAEDLLSPIPINVAAFDPADMPMEGIMFSSPFAGQAGQMLGNAPFLSAESFLMDTLQPPAAFSASSRRNSPVWEGDSNLSALLLASVAFAVVAIVVLSLHGVEPDRLESIRQMPVGYARNEFLVNEYLALFQPDHILAGSPQTRHYPWPMAGDPNLGSPNLSLSDASSVPELSVTSNYRPGSAGPSSSQAGRMHGGSVSPRRLGPSGASPSPRSLSPTTTTSAAASASSSADRGGGDNRLKCQQCGGTFSTVTNLNKHLRWACPQGDRPDRFVCPNGCGRSYSTAWYQKEHAEKRCPLRRRNE